MSPIWPVSSCLYLFLTSVHNLYCRNYFYLWYNNFYLFLNNNGIFHHKYNQIQYLLSNCISTQLISMLFNIHNVCGLLWCWVGYTHLAEQSSLPTCWNSGSKHIQNWAHPITAGVTSLCICMRASGHTRDTVFCLLLIRSALLPMSVSTDKANSGE